MPIALLIRGEGPLRGQFCWLSFQAEFLFQ
jgi:hypothetical protein